MISKIKRSININGEKTNNQNAEIKNYHRNKYIFKITKFYLSVAFIFNNKGNV